jgi:excisionase family DNA binding protein
MNRSKSTPAPRLMSVAAVALQLDVSQKTVRRLIEDGELPIHRIGRQIRISEPDLAAFIARSRCSS